MAEPHPAPPSQPSARAAEVFAAFLKLGLVSFGGPVAHLGYFHAEFVERRKWLSAAAYAEIVALCQFLPGPASSQVGMMIGLLRARLPGVLAAWLGFTLPSAALMIAFALLVAELGGADRGPWMHGLKIAAVAVVAQAIVVMARTLCPDVKRLLIAAVAAVTALLVPTAVGQLGAIGLGAIIGLGVLKDSPGTEHPGISVEVSRTTSLLALVLFVLLLAGLPLAATASGQLVDIADSFYRAGALVFGGGHVVLPLLEREVVPAGWIDAESFLAGYGAAQAVPGPLFTFAAFLGTAIGGTGVGLVALIAVFLPSFLLVVGVAPFWDMIRANGTVRIALKGVNAAVVGLLVAALYDPVVPGAVSGILDLGIAATLFALLIFARAPSWLIVLLGAAASSAIAMF